MYSIINCTYNAYISTYLKIPEFVTQIAFKPENGATECFAANSYSLKLRPVDARPKNIGQIGSKLIMSALQPKHIQVCCRIRGSEAGEPTVSSFLNSGGDGKDNKSYEVVTSSGSFQMDYAFDNNDSQDCIFDRIVQPMLSDAFTGFNCSLFSYGQTGSGTVYCMFDIICVVCTLCPVHNQSHFRTRIYRQDIYLDR